MNEHRWSDTRQHAIEHFNSETPGAQLEQDIIAHFADDPERVIRTINRIADQHKRKPLNSPWAVVRADLNRTAQQDVVASATAGRAKHIERAKNWIRNAGVHYDRESDVEAELFGDDFTRGRLHDHREDPNLREELLAYWRDQRPRGEQAERDHIAYSERCKANRAIVLELHKKHLADLAAKAEAHKPAAPQPEPTPEPELQPAGVTAGNADDDIPW